MRVVCCVHYQLSSMHGLPEVMICGCAIAILTALVHRAQISCQTRGRGGGGDAGGFTSLVLTPALIILSSLATRTGSYVGGYQV